MRSAGTFSGVIARDLAAASIPGRVASVASTR